jgi:hypothetical protein
VGGTFTFTAADFINAGTGYSSVGRNSPEAWAKVFNYRIRASRRLSPMAASS